MDTRRLGRTELDVSLLTFGCGAVGGLMTKGDARDQDRAVAWARDNGINHFDTAPLYGNGASETNLGRALGKNRDDVVVSTKVRVAASDRGHIEAAIRSSIDASLERLKQECVDDHELRPDQRLDEGQQDQHGRSEQGEAAGPAFACGGAILLSLPGAMGGLTLCHAPTCLAMRLGTEKGQAGRLRAKDILAERGGGHHGDWLLKPDSTTSVVIRSWPD